MTVKRTWIVGFAAAVLGIGVWSLRAQPESRADDRPGLVRCALLEYGKGKTARCFADHFLRDVRAKTNIWTATKFDRVRLGAARLFDYPFAVISGEGAFEFSPAERDNLRAYLTAGGFLVASPGCSSLAWQESFKKELTKVFPQKSLEPIPFADDEGKPTPIFNTLYRIDSLKTRRKGIEASLEGLAVDGRIVLVYSTEGLNDTPRAGLDETGQECCCCGANEILNARYVNANLLVYALTR